MKAALAQIAPRLSRDNIDIHESIVREVEGVADVVIFPECSLNGTMLQDAAYEDAFLLSELTLFETLSERIDIVVGALTKEEHKLYNSVLYYSRGQLLNLHHKINLRRRERDLCVAGDTIKSFMTPYGKSVVVTGDDLWQGDTLASIERLRPDFLYVVAASEAEGFTEKGLDILGRYMQVLSVSAMLGKSETIFVNRVGFEDGRGYWGASCVVTAEGKLSKQARLFEKEVLLTATDTKRSYIKKYLRRD